MIIILFKITGNVLGFYDVIYVNNEKFEIIKENPKNVYYH